MFALELKLLMENGTDYFDFASVWLEPLNINDIFTSSLTVQCMTNFV